ncbi:hypothetical protein [Nocardia aurantiaca]|uniref:XRE family transcriptional regulator n=1 Tax=Nocardia aurantiaca TaxID=2675850 RepID=A0A6I3L070_9NOCA|nr:hypothetical protein [Nocardia aurantiaca]MTE15267.1 hypothetical protein [Nocardia aurantiaca]
MFEMWERRHGRPLSDHMVAEWLTAAGYPVTADYLTTLRHSPAGGAPAVLRRGLAEVFDIDPAFFAVDPVLSHAADAGVAAEFENRSLRRLARLAQGMPLRAVLYLDTLAETLRRAEHLPDPAHTAWI